MKKALKMLVVLLLCAGVNVSAKTLKEETTSLISSMDTLKTESKDKIATLNKWLISNEAYVVKVLDKDLTPAAPQRGTGKSRAGKCRRACQA